MLGLCYSNPTDARFAEMLLDCFAQANLRRCRLVLEKGDESEAKSTIDALRTVRVWRLQSVF